MFQRVPCLPKLEVGARLHTDGRVETIRNGLDGWPRSHQQRRDAPRRGIHQTLAKEFGAKELKPEKSLFCFPFLCPKFFRQLSCWKTSFARGPCAGRALRLVRLGAGPRRAPADLPPAYNLFTHSRMTKPAPAS